VTSGTIGATPFTNQTLTFTVTTDTTLIAGPIGTQHTPNFPASTVAVSTPLGAATLTPLSNILAAPGAVGMNVRRYYQGEQPCPGYVRLVNGDRRYYKYYRTVDNERPDLARHNHLHRRVCGIHGFDRAATNATAAFDRPDPDRPDMPGLLHRKTEIRPVELTWSFITASLNFYYYCVMKII
jgi:hypothetical protein